ncbi:LacA, partial [Lactobacillus helveticus MTCC 5463]
MLEPEEGKYDFSELDKVVKKLSDANFDIVIGTSTAAMPAWMFKSIQMLPELIIKADDMFGQRYNFCPNSKNYQRLAGNLVEELVKH